jgi:hypothetical protein
MMILSSHNTNNNNHQRQEISETESRGGSKALLLTHLVL